MATTNQPVTPQPHYVEGFPVQVVEFAGRGRGLGAARDIRAGELVICCQRMGHAIRVKIEQYFCVNCLRHRLPDEEVPLPTMCQKCEAVWVCNDCNTPDFWSFHEPACKCLNVARSKKSLKTEERKLLRYLISVVAQHRFQTQGGGACKKCARARGSETQRESDAGGKKVTEENEHRGAEEAKRSADGGGGGGGVGEEPGRSAGGGGQETKGQGGGGGEEANDGTQYHECSLDDFLLMQRGPQDKRTMALFKRVAGLFVEHGGEELLGSLRSHVADKEETEELLVQILLRDRVNVFSLADAEGEEAGEMHFPAGAMMNHSCVPNIDARLVHGHLQVWAVSDIAQGEEVCHAYVPLTGGAGKRKAMIGEGWVFECACLRCANPAHPAVKRWDKLFLCSCGGACLQLPAARRSLASAEGAGLQGTGGGEGGGGARGVERRADSEGGAAAAVGGGGAGGGEEGGAVRTCHCNVHNLLPPDAADAGGEEEARVGGVRAVAASAPRFGSARSRAGQRARDSARDA